MRSVYLLPLILFAACDKPPCNNKNTAFDKNAPGSDAYDSELVTQIKVQPARSAHYWIEGYEEKDGKEYMNVEMQAVEMCAHMKLDITGNELLQGYRKVKGSGYNGAELKQPKIRIEQVNGKYLFYLMDVAAISD